MIKTTGERLDTIGNKSGNKPTNQTEAALMSRSTRFALLFLGTLAAVHFLLAILFHALVGFWLFKWV